MILTSELSGKFWLHGEPYFGALLLSGKNSKLRLFGDKQFPPVPDAYRSVTGELFDGRSVSVIDCVLQDIQNTAMRMPDTQGERQAKSVATMFPHYVCLGYRTISESDVLISSVSFFMRDALSVFYEFDDFGSVLDSGPFKDLLRQDKEKIRALNLGDVPIIQYFTGRFELARVEIPEGVVVASHSPTESLGGPRGVRIDNRVQVRLEFFGPKNLHDALDGLSNLVRFFETTIGRPQELNDIRLALVGDSVSSRLELVRSFETKYRSGRRPDRRPGPRDVLLCTIEHRDQLQRVLSEYARTDVERRGARWRYRAALARQGYSIDRIVAAANMFDIFPATAYPKAELPDEIASAARLADQLFRPLTEGPERSSILVALKKLGERSLKQKVRFRAESTGLDVLFPGLVEILDDAVDCRNHYVHGFKPKFDYDANFNAVCLFTNALEFVFGASDFIDCGWDIHSWKEGRPQDEHPFGSFVIDYKVQRDRYFSLKKGMKQ
jgi:hypothetical protein